MDCLNSSYYFALFSNKNQGDLYSGKEVSKLTPVQDQISLVCETISVFKINSNVNKINFVYSVQINLLSPYNLKLS